MQCITSAEKSYLEDEAYADAQTVEAKDPLSGKLSDATAHIDLAAG